MAPEKQVQVQGATIEHQKEREHSDDDDVSELQTMKKRSIYDKIREKAERFASTHLGQFVIERGDRALKMIEDTAKWSLPQEKNACPLERPLPWVPFLMMIVLLRLVRLWLSVGALMIGNAPVSPNEMVYFIQTRRRKLRAIRVHGLKEIKRQEKESSATSEKKQGFSQQLSKWLSRAICRPGVQRANSGRLIKVPTSGTEAQVNQSQSASFKRAREEDCNVDQNLSVDEMLSKYADENSEDDSDFVPMAEDYSDESSSLVETTTSDSGSETEKASEDHNNSSTTIVENGGHKVAQAEPEKFNIEETTTTTTSNGNSEKEQAPQAQTEPQADVAQSAKDEHWKVKSDAVASPMMNTRFYNNTAAAGSPTAFVPQSMLKNTSTVSVSVTSTPTSNDPQLETFDSEALARKHRMMNNHQQQQQQHELEHQPQPQQQRVNHQQGHHQQGLHQPGHYQQRFRGRNRR